MGSSTAPAVASVQAGASKDQGTNKNEVIIPPAAPNNFDFSMDNLALLVLLLGAVSVGVLFTMFKNSISE
jgi:hypothetical protein